MYNQYVTVNNKAIVSDTKGNQEIQNNYVNIENRLETKNVIEEIENNIKENKNDTETLINQGAGKEYFPWLLFLSFFFPLIIMFLSFNPYSTISSMIMTLKHGIFLSIPLCIISGILEISIYLKKFELNNKLNARKVELEYLEKELERQNEKLITLEKKNNIKNTNNYETNKIEESSTMKYLKETRNFFYNLGFNIDSYYKSYQKGKLRETLKDEYQTYEIDTIEEFIKDKEKKLINK